MDAAAPATKPERARWHGRTLGGVWLFFICANLLRVVGLPGAWIGSWIIGFGFLLVGGRDQYGSFAYWRRVRPQDGPLRRLWWIWRRYASFGRILCDRQLACLSPRRFRYLSDPTARDRVLSLIRDQGCILLAAHVGNWELSGNVLQGFSHAKLHMVMVRGDHPVVQAFVDKRMRPQGISVIDPRDALGASLQIYAALSEAGTVCMLGDRVIGEQPTVEAEFFGAPARFPVGPFHTAAVTGRTIVPAFLMRRGWRTYVFEIDEPYRVELPSRRGDRPAALRAAVQRFARRLEDQVRRYPLQWHNFYDFWAQ